MKRVLTLVLAVAMLLTTLTACGDKIYYKYKMEKYLSVGDYSKEVDKNSVNYKDAAEYFYEKTFGESLKSQVTTGKVEKGDVANIDYKGLLDGVAFDGGTAVGYDLTIGSGSFIDGFEDGLIGAEIGKTTNLNLKFPDKYHSAELAGKEVVFEVTVNYVTKIVQPNDSNVARHGYESLADYEEALEEYAAAYCIYCNIYDATTINSYPQKEEKLLYNYAVETLEKLCKENGMTMADLASANNMTEDALYDYISENEVRYKMKQYMVAYYILESRGSKLTKEQIEKKRSELDEIYDESLESIGYYEINIQQEAAFDEALNLLKKEYKIK